jgi:hypothetical protein
VDGVALASVITSGVLGITTSGIAVWSARQNAKLARETRLQQRLADSYLEVLRIVEREAQRVETSITGWKTLAEAAEDPYGYGPEPRAPSRAEQEQTQEEFLRGRAESAADQVMIKAHLAAFGSDNVGALYRVWLFTITEIDNERRALEWNCQEDWPGGRSDIPPGALTPMLAGLEALQPKEDAARHALEDAIAAELGHRRQIGHHGLLGLLGALGRGLPPPMRNDYRS